MAQPVRRPGLRPGRRHPGRRGRAARSCSPAGTGPRQRGSRSSSRTGGSRPGRASPGSSPPRSTPAGRSRSPPPRPRSRCARCSSTRWARRPPSGCRCSPGTSCRPRSRTRRSTCSPVSGSISTRPRRWWSRTPATACSRRRGAGLPCLVTVNGYTRAEAFDEAVLVVSELGDPDRPPVDVLAARGPVRPEHHVTLDDLRACAGTRPPRAAQGPPAGQVTEPGGGAA